MNKKYVVELTEVERKRLRKLISTGSAPARMLNRARILLKADVGEHVAERGPHRQRDRRDAGYLHGHRPARARAFL